VTWVKICGITTPEAIRSAERAGADALGFVLAPGSVRTLSVEAARPLVGSASISTYVVVVDLHPEEAMHLANEIGVTGIQAHGLHGLETARAAVEAGFDVLCPIPVGQAGPTTDPAVVVPEAVILFDTERRRGHGGSGKPFTWTTVADVERPYVVAGGLGPGNVREVIDQLDPFGVDASSQLEARPGIKDPDTIRAFVEEAKR
jgi:phosphoribosylanthranilate isomerase